MSMDDKCVCCGEYVPEGRRVCLKCETNCNDFIGTLDKVKVHQEICKMLNTVYEKKKHDYGDSFAKLRSELPLAILVRIYDKYSRLKTLLQGKQQLVKDESIDDTLMDLANYCIMELVERKVNNYESK